MNQEVWATILALIWFHGFKMDAQEEWELLAMEAVVFVLRMVITIIISADLLFLTVCAG